MYKKFILLLFFALLIACASVNIPCEYLRPSKVNEGWLLIEENFETICKRVKYKKGNSTFSITVNRYSESPASREKDKKDFDDMFDTLFKNVMSVELTREETLEINGLEIHVLQYEVSHQRKPSQRSIMIFFAWYCHNLKRNINADASIKDKPIDLYINEVEEMVRSIKCP